MFTYSCLRGLYRHAKYIQFSRRTVITKATSQEVMASTVFFFDYWSFDRNTLLKLWNGQNSWFTLKSASILGIGDWRLERPMRCTFQMKCAHFERPLTGMVFLWLHHCLRAWHHKMLFSLFSTLLNGIMDVKFGIFLIEVSRHKIGYWILLIYLKEYGTWFSG